MTSLRFAIILPVVAILASCSASADIPNAQQTGPQSLATPACIPADTIIVANFHGTRRCASCLAVGNLAQKTVEQEFPKEYRKGKIEFLSIDGDNPENVQLVQKYQARGSSLFINAIHGVQETIEEDVTVWRLAGNEEAYIRYLKEKISALLYCS